MPREQIVYPRVYEHKLIADNGGPVPDVQIERHIPAPIPHVTWHGAPDSGGWGWMQLMFDCDREYLVNLLADTPKDQPFVEIHSEVLDRAAANRLIKHGRRARNAAYGVDE